MKKRTSACFYMRRAGKSFFLYGSCVGIFTLVLYLYDAPLDAVQYAALLAGGLFVLVGIVGVVRSAVRCKKVGHTLASLPNEWSELPSASTLPEEMYQGKLKQLFDLLVQTDSQVRAGRREMVDYYTLWAHQIKTPMAAMHVLVQSLEESLLSQDEKRESLTDKAETTRILRDMKMELFQTEQYVEMVLSYLRAEEMGHDLLLKEYPLDAIVKQAVKKYSAIFISKKIRLEYQTCQEMVLTDEKWLVFVLEQLLSNALKYTPSGGMIAVYVEGGEEGRLVIKDNGIGIQAEDLPRIFEKGFTGFNGRKDKKSTGIGLYLCKMICDKLGHKITVESEEGNGTRVCLGIVQKQRK